MTIFAGSGLALSALKAQPVTVLLEYDKPVSLETTRSLQVELTRIFSDSRIQLDLRLKNEVPEYSQFEELVLFRMKGSCSIRALPVTALSDERGPLAMTHMVNGELLPFGEVGCDRVRTSVQRRLGRGSPASHEAQLGIALARVMAHEVYHRAAHFARHTKVGIPKAALSSEELFEGELPLPSQARDKLYRHSPR